jgi:REP element-mobilizing transposase RayT
MGFDPERHHRRSIRLPAYDYSCGVYFVTICTYERAPLFGQVVGGGMAMNELGWIVWEEWERSTKIRRELDLGAFVVMPNHLHGIVTIAPDHQRSPVSGEGWRRKPWSLGSFISGFKGATTSKISSAMGMQGTPIWQRNYYEKVIRDERMLERIWW